MTEKTKKPIGLGVEIECVYNTGYGHLDILERGDYHEGTEINDFWELQSDSSISREGKFKQEMSGEFVMYKQITKEDFFNALKSFKQIMSFNGKYALDKVIYFPDSCGAHIHFSLGKSKFKDKIPFEYLLKMRKLFFEKLEKSIILSDNTKLSIKNQYFRHYAQKITKDNYFKGIERYAEFNTQSEDSGYGLEWRSFNIYNLKDWREFDEIFHIAYESIEYLFNLKENGYKIERNVSIKRKELKNLFKEDTKEIKLKNRYNDEVSLKNINLVYEIKDETEEKEIKII
jgi:hypothetical protein